MAGFGKNFRRLYVGDLQVYDQIKITENGAWIVGEDSAGNEVSIFKVDTDGYIDFGTILKIGALYHEADSGVVNILSMPLTTDTPSGDDIGFKFLVGTDDILKAYVESDGAGGAVANSSIVEVDNIYVRECVYDHSAAVTADVTLANVVPAKYLLEYIILTETAGNTATISIGTSSDGTEIFTNQAVTASTVNIFSVKQYNASSPISLYIHDNAGGDSFNSASLTVKLVMRRIAL